MKKSLKYLSVIALLLVITTGCGTKTKAPEVDKKENVNTNQGVIEEKVVEGLKLTNTSLVSTGNSAKLITQVTNEGTEDSDIRLFNIYVKDKNGETIVTLQGYVGGLAAGATKDIISNVEMNLDNAYNVEYEIVK